MYKTVPNLNSFVLKLNLSPSDSLLIRKIILGKINIWENDKQYRMLNSELKDRCPNTQKWYSQCIHGPGEREVIFTLCNEIIDGIGIEWKPTKDFDIYEHYSDGESILKYHYINRGDNIGPTLLFKDDRCWIGIPK